MADAIIVAMITAGASIIATFLTVQAGNNKTRQMIEVTQAVQEQKISDLTREVREHNKFAERIPQAEVRIDALEKRVDKLEAQ